MKENIYLATYETFEAGAFAYVIRAKNKQEARDILMRRNKIIGFDIVLIPKTAKIKGVNFTC
jgi:hypothetical protein